MQRETDSRRDGIEREFRYAIQALAADPDAQIATLSPGCVTCELYEDFAGYYQAYLDAFANDLIEPQRAQIIALHDALEAMPDADCECGNVDLLNRESWSRVRKMARAALESLGWPLQPPPAFHEIEPGVWKRT